MHSIAAACSSAPARSSGGIGLAAFLAFLALYLRKKKKEGW